MSCLILKMQKKKNKKNPFCKINGIKKFKQSPFWKCTKEKSLLLILSTTNLNSMSLILKIINLFRKTQTDRQKKVFSDIYIYRNPLWKWLTLYMKSLNMTGGKACNNKHLIYILVHLICTSSKLCTAYIITPVDTSRHSCNQV